MLRGGGGGRGGFSDQTLHPISSDRCPTLLVVGDTSPAVDAVVSAGLVSIATGAMGGQVVVNTVATSAP